MIEQHWHEIWIEYCEAAEDIGFRYGIERVSNCCAAC